MSRLTLGTADWYDINPNRAAIYNANYAPSGKKTLSLEKPWRADSRGFGNASFATYEEAASYVRDRLSDAEPEDVL